MLDLDPKKITADPQPGRQARIQMPRRVPDVPPALRLLLGRADLPGGGGARLMQLLIAAVLCNAHNLNIRTPAHKLRGFPQGFRSGSVFAELLDTDPNYFLSGSGSGSTCTKNAPFKTKVIEIPLKSSFFRYS